MHRADLIRQLLQLLITHQRRNRYVGRAFGTGLSLAEAFILLQLENSPSSLKQLVETLRIPRSSVSRHVQGLAARSLVSLAASPSDRRAVLIRLAGRAASSLQDYHQRANDNLKRFLRHLSEEEAGELTALERRFADGLEVGPLRIGAALHPLRNEIARHTIGLELLSRGIFGQSDRSAVEWHLLSLLRARPEGVKAQQLRALLDLTAPLLSRSVRQLEERRMLRHQKGDDDRREMILFVSPGGLQELERLEKRAAARIQRGVSRFSDEELARFVVLFGRFVGPGSPGCGVLDVFRSQLRLSRLVAPEERSEARVLRVTEAVAAGKAAQLGETLFTASGWSFGLRRDEELVAAFEITPQGGRARLENLVARPQALDVRQLTGFVEGGVRQFVEQTGLTRIEQAEDLPQAEAVAAVLSDVRGLPER